MILRITLFFFAFTLVMSMHSRAQQNIHVIVHVNQPVCAVVSTEQSTPAFAIFPNPAKHLVSIWNKDIDAQILIKDNYGREQRHATAHAGQQLLLDLSALPRGNYLIELRQNQTLKFFRLVLQ